MWISFIVRVRTLRSYLHDPASRLASGVGAWRIPIQEQEETRQDRVEDNENSSAQDKQTGDTENNTEKSHSAALLLGTVPNF